MDLEARVVACAHQSVSLGAAKSFLGDGASVLAGQVARSENRMAMPWSRHRVDGVQGVICHGQRSAAESDSQKGINSLRVTWVTCPEGR